MNTEGTFTGEHTVRLRTGQTIVNVQSYDVEKYPGLANFFTGWLGGTLYTSHDGGATWGASSACFRAA